MERYKTNVKHATTGVKRAKLAPILRRSVKDRQCAWCHILSSALIMGSVLPMWQSASFKTHAKMVKYFARMELAFPVIKIAFHLFSLRRSKVSLLLHFTLSRMFFPLAVWSAKMEAAETVKRLVLLLRDVQEPLDVQMEHVHSCAQRLQNVSNLWLDVKMEFVGKSAWSTTVVLCPCHMAVLMGNAWNKSQNVMANVQGFCVLILNV